MAHVEVNQAPAPTRPARCPRKNDAAVKCDPLPSARIVNLCDLPAETRARCEEHQGENNPLLVASYESEEAVHIQEGHRVVPRATNAPNQRARASGHQNASEAQSRASLNSAC
jgi:hypothetical protein